MTSGAQNEDMHVASLWRYPVKSMQGETCAELVIERNGVAHDRGFGVLDVQSGTIISAKREGRMLEAAAKLVFDEVVVTLPGGQELDQGDVLDECLTRWLGRAVRLVDATTYGVATFESPNDFERDDSALESWEGVEGKFVDDSALHLLTTADLENLTSERGDLQWDVRRFRPNLVIDAGAGALDAAGRGQRLLVGEVEIEIEEGCTRCVMTTRPQPGNLERQLDILRHVSKNHDNVVGLRARVVRTGTVRVGDVVQLVG
jgi:uncharacterized protein YcbX